MEKQEFIKTLERMVEFYSSHENFSPYKYMESAVGRWAKAHPVKTRQTEFLKQFPRADCSDSGIINICPQEIDTTIACHAEEDCKNCCKRYWNEEIE